MKDIGMKFIESATKLAEELLEKDNLSEAEERFLLAFSEFGEELKKHLPSEMWS